MEKRKQINVRLTARELLALAEVPGGNNAERVRWLIANHGRATEQAAAVDRLAENLRGRLDEIDRRQDALVKLVRDKAREVFLGREGRA